MSSPSQSSGPAADTGFVVSRDGTQLYFSRLWAEAPDDERGRSVLLIVHGYGEHCGRYEHVLRHLHGQGHDVLAFDYRGHGRSQGRRGHVRRFEEYLQDLDAAVGFATSAPGGCRKLLLLGHSLGGLIVASYALEHPEGIDGVVLTSPFFGFEIEVGAVKRFLGKTMSLVWPTLSLPTDIPPEHLSTDPEVGKAYELDKLVNKVATARWFTETLAMQETVMARARRILVPTLVMQAADDRIAKASESQRFVERLGATDKELKWYDGMYHEILNEVRREEVLADLTEWLAGH